MTLTPEQVAAGWIKHDGGPCPVPLDSSPAVMFRDGEKWLHGGRIVPVSARYLDWQLSPKHDAPDDIIAYKEDPQP